MRHARLKKAKPDNVPGFFGVPLLRYTGAKWKLADWIISQFPPHKLYIEPFCGSAAIFFRKSQSKIEVLNDRYGVLVNFFRVLRERPEQLIKQIELTPFSRAEYEAAYEPSDDPLESARRFYVLSWQSFGAFAGRRSGWRYQKNTHRGTLITREWQRTEGLWTSAKRLRDAQIDNLDAIKAMQTYDSETTLHYVDPPYVKVARSEGSRSRYMHEMNDQDHRELAACLHSLKGMVILSGYDCKLYRELFGDWRRIEKSTSTNGNSDAMESLWLSPNVDAAWGRFHRNESNLAVHDLPLFGGGA